MVRPVIACVAFTVALVQAASSLAADIPWRADEAHCKAVFSTGHYGGLAKVTGFCNVPEATLEFDGKNLEKARITATVDPTTLTTGCHPRDFHLKSTNFLDIGKFKTITFVSKAITPAGPGKFKMTGDLTMKGITKPVTLECTGPTGPITDFRNLVRIGATGTTRINRKDFKLDWNREVAKGVMMVDDMIDIRLEVEFFRRKV